MSFLLRKTDSGVGANRNVEMSLNAGSGTQVVRFGSTSSNAGPNANESRFFFGGVGGTQTSTIPVTYGESYFIVLKGVPAAAGNDQFLAATYDSAETVPLTEPGAWDITYSVGLGNTIDQIRPTLGTSADRRIRRDTHWRLMGIGNNTGACVADSDFGRLFVIKRPV